LKFDDLINGALAILLGAALILGARSLPTVNHIQFGPGLFPTLVGLGFVGAGFVLIIRRLRAGEGVVDGFMQIPAGDYGSTGFRIASVLLVLGAILFYILVVDWLGFLLTMPLILLVLILWFDRRPLLDLACAVVATLILHTFFYQLMSVPLPWGVLETYAGVLTW